MTDARTDGRNCPALHYMHADARQKIEFTTPVRIVPKTYVWHVKSVYVGQIIEARIYATTSANHTVSTGTTVELACETDTLSKIRWNFNSPQYELPLVLFSGFSVNSNVTWRISINATAHWNQLAVRVVSIDDSGVYSCHEVDTFTEMVNFHVTVHGALLL